MTHMSREEILAAVKNGANLNGADLYGADLYGAKDVPSSVAASTMTPPETGAFQAWKSLRNNHVALLSIPETAKRSSATSRKCRVSIAQVLTIFNAQGERVDGPVASRHDPSFTYTVGDTVSPTEPFEDDRWLECAPGIHCFLTRYEAENY